MEMYENIIVCISDFVVDLGSHNKYIRGRVYTLDDRNKDYILITYFGKYDFNNSKIEKSILNKNEMWISIRLSREYRKYFKTYRELILEYLIDY